MIFVPSIIALIILWCHGKHPVACWVVAGSWILTWLVSKTVITARADFKSAQTEQAGRVFAGWLNAFNYLYWVHLGVCIIAVVAAFVT